jgi:RecJ-like exonuclease
MGKTIIMEGVEEKAEGYPVVLEEEEDGTLVITAENEGGCNGTGITLKSLLMWLQTDVGIAATKKVGLMPAPKTVTCDWCEGTGSIPGRCTKCKGTGRIVMNALDHS